MSELSISAYQKQTASTANYPGMCVSPLYPALGLAGESAELLEKVIEHAPREEIAAELGDVLWYISRVASDSELQLALIVDKEDFSRLFSVAVELDSWAVELEDRERACTRLVIYAGKISEAVKKMLRDDRSQLTAKRRQLLGTLLQEVLEAVGSVARALEEDLTDVAQGNLDKLQSRQQRGVIAGSGDNR